MCGAFNVPTDVDVYGGGGGGSWGGRVRVRMGYGGGGEGEGGGGCLDIVKQPAPGTRARVSIAPGFSVGRSTN